jgi:hypothetical protein
MSIETIFDNSWALGGSYEEARNRTIKLIREQIALELEVLRTPTDISSDWYAATRVTKKSAIAIVLDANA